MPRLLTCIIYDHDYRFVALAALICVTGSWIGIRTFVMARAGSRHQSRNTWILVSSIAMSSAIWTTHFLAMIAYKPGLQVAWDAGISAISLALAFAGTFASLYIGSRRHLWLAPELGGIFLGLTIAGMHYTGMHAYIIPGTIVWNPAGVWTALTIGVVFGALSLNRVSRPLTRFCKPGGTASLVVAICGLHFTSMAAMTVTFDPLTSLPDGFMPTAELGLCAGFFGIVLLAMSFVTYSTEKKNSAHAVKRMMEVTGTASDGILIVSGGVVTDANAKFLELADASLDLVAGQRFSAVWAAYAACPEHEFPNSFANPFELDLRSRTGQLVPVQVVASRIAADESLYAFRDLRERRANEVRLSHMALHDSLTGLFNRTGFSKAAGGLIAAGAPFTIGFVDLDRFKETNDVHGHGTGDAVLVEVTRRIKDCLPDAIGCRLGGDEFALALAGPKEETERALHGLAAALRDPFRRGGTQVRTNASTGIAHFHAHGETLEELLANADIAMYQAKVARTSGAVVFETGIGEAAHRRRLLSEDLTTAMADGSFAVHYQLQTDARTGRIAGFEALLRWNHPKFGAVPPSEFIPIAESNGTIRAIGAWVLNKACHDATAWHDSVTVAVNMSPAQIDGTIANTISAALAATGLAPARLEIEITESLLVDGTGEALEILRAIKKLGVSIAMDDFGTGYSSLSMLGAFPFDKIKIDQSLIRNITERPHDGAIVRAIVGLGKNLEIAVLAEGIETKEQMAFLRDIGCNGAQGYLMGRPVSHEQTLSPEVTTLLLQTTADLALGRPDTGIAVAHAAISLPVVTSQGDGPGRGEAHGAAA